MLLRASIVWVVILLVAIANGAAREAFLVPRFGAAVGHVLSTLSLCLVILCVSWFALPVIGVTARADAWTVGLLWTALTLAFELLAGHYLFGATWDTLLADYDLVHGRIRILVPIVTLLSPIWINALRR